MATHDSCVSTVSSGRFFCLATLTVTLCLSIPVSADWFKHTFNVMGTRAAIELWADNSDQAQAAFAAVEVEMRRIDALMSPYIATSELSKINQLGKQQTLSISEEMYAVLQKSLYFSRLTHGVFDISFASAGHLYNYREGKLPDEHTLEKALAAIDYNSIKLSAARQTDGTQIHTITLLRDGMTLDLGGIAKGYAVDNSVQLLKNRSVAAAIVSAGGDTRILGHRGVDKATGEVLPWVVAIQHPRSENEHALRLPLTDTAISTSGDYERYFMHGDERIHHILKPSTGKSAQGIVSATVIGPESIQCDALSTSVFALGVEAGIALIETLDQYEAIIINSRGKLYYTSGLVP